MRLHVVDVGHRHEPVLSVAGAVSSEATSATSVFHGGLASFVGASQEENFGATKPARVLAIKLQVHYIGACVLWLVDPEHQSE